MKIEAGKFYRTRDGSKARIYATDGSEIHGAVNYCWVWIQVGWLKLGRYKGRSDHDFDLVSEWSEPKLRQWTPDEVPLGSWARRDSDGFRGLITAVGEISAAIGLDFYGLSELSKEWTHSTDNGKTWLPCGVEEGK
jgi:hypothetical protein